MRTTARNICVALASAALIAGSAAGPVAAKPGHGHDDGSKAAKKLTKAVTVKKVLRHLDELQEVADENGGNRASGLPGYEDSVDYITEELEDAGYDPEVQAFEFEYTEENSELERISPDPRVYVEGSEFVRNEFDTGTPEGTATGNLFLADVVLDPSGPPNTSSSGCEETDFDGMAPGSVALVQRGTCGFNVKVLNAQAEGAAAVVVMNEGQPGRTGLVGMIGDATGLTIPAVFATFDAGLSLAATPGASVRVTVEFTADTRTTWNVLAETSRGNDDNVVMAGAHLDSVQDGAGINDNGTGSAGLLETAIQLSKKNIKHKNTVRFAWWGAEESGLLGSEHYVANLTPEEAERITLYLNFDMIGSPNYFTGIYDGDNSGGTAPPGFIPPGSAEIEDVFEDFYSDRRKPFEDTEFSGRSDYGPFIAVGIPAGGLFTGAEGVKTEEQAALYGGVAGAAFDPCYHSFCDNLRGDGQDEDLYDQLREDYRLVGNVNVRALDQNSDALANTVVRFAFDTSAVEDAQSATPAPGARVGANAIKNRYAR